MRLSQSVAKVILFLTLGLPLVWLAVSIVLVAVYGAVKHDCGWTHDQCMTRYNTTYCLTQNLRRVGVADGISCPGLTKVYEIYWTTSTVFGVLVVGAVVASLPVVIAAVCVVTYCKEWASDHCDC
jgi:hypothetical protein